MKPRQQADAALEAALRSHRAGQLDAAAVAYQKILRLRPAHVGALTNLGVIHRQKGRYDQARSCFEQALRHDPHSGLVWSNLANLYVTLGQPADAVVAAQRAVKEAPGLAAAHDNLGLALFQLNRFDEAEQSLQQSLKLNPKFANAWNNLGQVYQRQNRLAEAAGAYQHSVELDPSFSLPFSNLIFCMHFGSQWSREAIFAAHVQWARQFESPIAALAPKVRPSTGSAKARPRVAFISPDLCNHPVSVFLKPLIANWPHDQFDLGFYASVRGQDETTQWFKEHANSWCDIHAMSDEAAAGRIAQDQVDILIDLAGHTGGGRLLVLAHRPAPVQIAWLGYFDTTGMSSVRYIVADPVCVPPALEHLFTEKVLRMPDGFVCFEPPATGPEPGPLPALANGYVTFGSQNQLAKITDSVIALWSELLGSMPGARLLFQAKAFNDSQVVDRYARLFENHGVNASRIDFLPSTTMRGILNNYRRIDIALDPFPCAGGTTTCEALWMGVPVISLLGDRFGGRHSASHLSNVGLPDLIAFDPKQYLELAHSLASDLPALKAIREQLRNRLLASPLCDGPRFARHFAEMLLSVMPQDS